MINPTKEEIEQAKKTKRHARLGMIMGILLLFLIIFFPVGLALIGVSPYSYATAIGTIAILVLAFVYFIPTIVAIRRKKKNDLAIMLLNIFLGWTLIGWVVALVWAATKD